MGTLRSHQQLVLVRMCYPQYSNADLPHTTRPIELYAVPFKISNESYKLN